MYALLITSGVDVQETLMLGQGVGDTSQVVESLSAVMTHAAESLSLLTLLIIAELRKLKMSCYPPFVLLLTEVSVNSGGFKMNFYV